MKPVLRYFGSKFKSSKRILPCMDPHRVYCEPYGGSAGVLLRKSESGVEIYNEINSRIFNLMSVLKSPEHMTELCHRIANTKWCKSNWTNAYTQVTNPVDDALNVLIRSWMSFSPVGIFRENSGYRTGAYDKANVSSGHQHIWNNLPLRIQGVHARIRRIHMYQLDALELIDYIDKRYGADALYYVDPPYLHSTRIEKRGYESEMTLDDHVALINTLQGVKGKVLLSGYQNSLYETLLSDSPWYCDEFQSYAASNTGSTARKEALWTNYQHIGLLQQSDIFIN